MDVESVADMLGRLADLPGVGVDVEVVERFIEPDERLFTPAELAYCAAQPNPAESRAGRWCAKEAVAKACAAFLRMSLREIEVLAEPSGRPVAALPGRATELGLAAAVSISHAGGAAVAVAVAAVCHPPSRETSLGSRDPRASYSPDASRAAHSSWPASGLSNEPITGRRDASRDTW